MNRSYPRANHVYQIWQKVLALPELPQFDRWLAEEFKRNPKYGSRDRKWYSEVLFAAVRFAYLSLFCEKSFLNKNADFQSIQNELKEEIDSPARFFSALQSIPTNVFFVWTLLRLEHSNDERGLPPDSSLKLEEDTQREQHFLKVIRFLSTSTDLDGQMTFAGIPLWFSQILKKRAEVSNWSSAQTKEFIDKQNVRSPLWLRLNHPEKAQGFFEELEKEGFEMERHDNAVMVFGLKGIFTTQAYRDGLFEIQDFASQQIGLSVAAQPGQLVWDSCAGGGGKTLQIASNLGNKGAVYASDVREYKLEEVKKRARRASFHNVRCIAWDGVNLPQFPREVQVRKGFDKVLVDAPCSSTGTWRRNPDAKYRVDTSNLESLVTLQMQILKNAVPALREGGQLIYSTCSFAVEENEDVVKNFLTEHTNFHLEAQHLFGCPDLDADTMYAAVLTKK